MGRNSERDGVLQLPTLAASPLRMNDTIIDLTPVVEQLKRTFILAAQEYIVTLALAVPGIGPVASWFVKVLLSPLLRWALTKLADWSAMQAFFLNTAIRKADQAHEWVKTIDELRALPDTVDEITYEEAERAQIASFHDFVRVTT